MFKSVIGFAVLAVAVAVSVTVFDRWSGGEGPAWRAGDPQTVAAETGAGRITAITADSTGHFRVAALVNGVHVDMMADTGATVVVLTTGDAQRLGLDPGMLTFDVPVQTANGRVMNALVVLDDIDVGGIVVRDVRALVAPDGVLAHSLLGMSYIGQLTRFELKGDQLVLVE